ncbi:flagellar export protein FliJ [Sporolactobacillus sp. THM7-4]|nr:flagellar export protein FliJ [Sporolactobacillus sp. THM7-4]
MRLSGSSLLNSEGKEMKMGFEFRLERLMKVAKSEKKSLEQEYQTLFDYFERLARNLMNLIENRKKAESALHDKMKQPITIGSMKSRIFDVENIDRLIAKRTDQYDQVKEQLEKFQTVLQAKAIDVKKFEKLKEKQKVAYCQNKKKKEAKVLDELASVSYKFKG